MRGIGRRRWVRRYIMEMTQWPVYFLFGEKESKQRKTIMELGKGLTKGQFLLSDWLHPYRPEGPTGP